MDLAPTISTQGLTRRFGELLAVDGVDLRVSPGQFFGFLGPNGAGKSTTIKMLTGLLAPTSGSIEILGLDLEENPVAVKRQIGVVPEGMALFGRLTGKYFLNMNPWLLEEASSGSSAGPAAATAAGLVAFAIGSETGGSIISPSMRCGITGLRPTYGRVARTGAMTLCWSLDKLGPMTRTVEDAMLVLHAISGPDAARCRKRAQ